MAKGPSFGTSYSTALMKLRLGDRERPEEIFPRMEKKSFDDLKKEYTDKYGYIIRIPKLEEVIHLTPNFMKSDAEVKAEKRKGLMNILGSPAPDFARKYSTVMTWLDNIQDTTSLIYPAMSMLLRLAPKVFGRILPVMGWMMLGGDILSWANAIGRLAYSPWEAIQAAKELYGQYKGMNPMTRMGAKRLTCHWNTHNPFSSWSQYLRKERIKNFKPTVADLIQAAQVTDQFIGVGLNLGPIMGAATDAIFGAYHYIKGDPVRIAYDVPDMFEFEKLAGRGIETAGLINSAGQTFDDETHFWSLVIGAGSARVFTPVAHDFDIMGSVEDPMNVMVPAPIPTDPLTIEVIKEQGLNVEDGVGWPYNGEKEISIGNLWDELMPRNRDVFRDFCFRHSKDWYGYIVAHLWDQVTPSMIFAADPSGSVEFDDSPEMKVLYKMVKAPILPTGNPSEAQKTAFISWATQYNELYGETPTIREIKEKLTNLGISFSTDFSDIPTADSGEFWPSDFPVSDYSF